MLKLYDVTLRWTLASRAVDDGGPGRHVRGDGLSVRDHPQGVHPHRGQRHRLRVHRGRPGRVVRVDDGASAGGGRRRPPAALRRAVHVVHRRQRLQHRAEQRADLHAAQAARPAAQRGGGDRRPSAQAGRRPRDPRLSADPADHPHRRTAHQGRLPVHAAGRRPRRALPVGARALRSAAAASQPAGRQHGSADHEPADRGGHRSRQGLDARDQRRSDPDRAGRRLWLAAGLDHLHAVEPVLGHPRGRSASTSETRPRWAGSSCAPPTDAWCRSTRSPG